MFLELSERYDKAITRPFHAVIAIFTVVLAHFTALLFKDGRATGVHQTHERAYIYGGVGQRALGIHPVTTIV